MLTPAQCGVIFDLDGVIVDTKEAHHASFSQLGAEVGYSISSEQFQHIFGMHNNSIFPYLYGCQLQAAEIEMLADRKEALFRAVIHGKITALPGVTELLPALVAAGFKLAIGTSTPLANVDLILGELNFAQYFTAISSAEDVTIGKPNPQVFLIAAQRLGIAPARCVVVEDAIAGVDAALAGGMVPLAVTTNHPRPALEHAARVVDSLAEVGPAEMLGLLQG